MKQYVISIIFLLCVIVVRGECSSFPRWYIIIKYNVHYADDFLFVFELNCRTYYCLGSLLRLSLYLSKNGWEKERGLGTLIVTKG